MRTVLREERRHERIRHGFQRPVGKGKNKHADGQHLIGVRRGVRHERDHRRQHVQRKSRDHQLAVADFVADDSADNNTEAKAGESGAADGAQLRGGEAKLGAPVVENTAADAEAHAGGEDGHKAGPKEAFGVGRDALIADVFVAHRCGLAWVDVGEEIALRPRMAREVARKSE